MAIKKTIEITADTKQAEKSIEDLGNIIQEQKDITIEFEKELRNLEIQLKNTSKANLSEQKVLKDRISVLKEALKDQRISLKELNNERSKAIKGNTDYSAGLLKTSPIIRKINTATGGLSNSFIDIARAAKLSGKAMRTALISSGIGAAVVLVGLLVEHWDDISEFIGSSNEKIQEQIDKSIIVQESLKLQVSLVEKQLILSGKQGLENEELQKQRIELLKILREENALELSKLELQASILKTAALELTTREKILRTTLNILGKGAGDALILDKQLESLEEYNKIQNLITKSKTEQVGLDIKLFDLENPENAKASKSRVQGREKVTSVGEIKTSEEQDKIREQQAKFFDEQFELEKFREDQLTTLKIDEDLKRSAAAVNESQKRIEQAEFEAAQKIILEESLRNSKVAIATETLNLLSVLAKEGSDLARGVAAAQALMSTYSSAVKAFDSLAGIPIVGSVLGGIAAAAAVVSGLSNVKKILSTKSVETSVTGGGSGQSVPQPPAFNLVQGTGTNQVAQSIQGQDPVKAFVVSSDMTNSQSFDRNIKENASL
jgi:hypothetical protein